MTKTKQNHKNIFLCLCNPLHNNTFSSLICGATETVSLHGRLNHNNYMYDLNRIFHYFHFISFLPVYFIY